MAVKGATYSGSNDPVQGSWHYVSHENLVATATPTNSSNFTDNEIILTCADDIRVGFGETASAASPLFLRGDYLLYVDRGSFLSVIRVGADDVQVTIKIPE